MYTDFGHVKRTEGQIKKHRSQFTKEEVNKLNSILNGLSLKPSNHAMKRHSIKARHIQDAIRSYRIVEFNYTFKKSQPRVLIRGNACAELDDSRRYNLCIVIALKTGDIVTMYWNLCEDSHSNLNMSRYSDFSIEEYISR